MELGGEFEEVCLVINTIIIFYVEGKRGTYFSSLFFFLNFLFCIAV